MNKKRKVNVFITPHFHYDYLWCDTADGMGARSAKIIQKALLLMRKYPKFKYVIDSVMPLKYFQLHYPEMWQELKNRVNQGRIELMGGMVVAPDTLMPRAETLIRQILYGKKYLKKEFNVNPKIGYLLDSFGQTAQLPQILKKADYELFMFVRGARNLALPQEFYWKALDGSKILTHWMYATYTWVAPPFAQTILPPLFPFFPIPFTLNIIPQAFGIYEFLKKLFPPIQYLFQKIGSLNAGVSVLGADMGGLKFTIKNRLKRATTKNIFILNGTDNIPPSTNILDIVQYVQKKTNKFDIKISLPTNFLDALKHSSKKFGVFGPHEFNGFPDKFSGTFSNRIKLKQIIRKVENIQYLTECVASFASEFTDYIYPADVIEKALWKLLQASFHDALPGCHIDKAYKNIMSRLNDAYSKLSKIKKKALNSLIKYLHIPQNNEDLKPIIIFNPNSSACREVVHLNIPSNIKNFEILCDDETKIIPQLDKISSENRYMFYPSSIPPFAFKIFFLKPVKDHETPRIKQSSREKKEKQNQNQKVDISCSSELREVKNSRFTLTFENNKLRTIRDQKTGIFLEAKKYFINDLRIFNDRGDSYLHGKKPKKIYETYDNKATLIEQGSVRTVVKLCSKLKCSNKWFFKPVNEITQYIILYESDISRIDFITSFRNQIKNIRIQACFPLNMKNPIFRSEIPDGFMERDTKPLKGSSWADYKKRFAHYDRIYPVLNWMDASDTYTEKGVSLFNQGLPEYEIGPNKENMFLTLLKSTGYISNIFPSAVPMVLGPFYSILKAYELTSHQFRYSLYFHEGQNQTDLISQNAMIFNIGLLPEILPKKYNQKGELENLTSLIHIKPQNFLIKSIKLAESSEGIIIRVLETANQKTKANMRIFKDLKSLYLTNLLEEPIKKLTPKEKNTYYFEAKPQEILTFLLIFSRE